MGAVVLLRHIKGRSFNSLLLRRLVISWWHVADSDELRGLDSSIDPEGFVAKAREILVCIGTSTLVCILELNAQARTKFPV